MARRFLVTGGAGYVGSHLVTALRDRGDEVVVLDNLRTGHAEAVADGARLVVASLADDAALEALLSEGPWDGVFHFAAMSLVGESMQQPLRYLTENGAVGIRLIEACVRHGVRRFVLSSTANLYGLTPNRVPIPEDSPLDPSSPYGESKRMMERALHWADHAHGLRSACLRYFNAAGADPDLRLGEDHRPETHLIPLVIDATLGITPPVKIFGTNYETPDGTCVRDYIHVSDLATAHLLAFEELEHRSVTYNLGTGVGYSVMDVIASVGRVSGRPVPYEVAPPRSGDPPVLIASADRIRAETGWLPRFDTLDDIVKTAFAWRVAHPGGYG
jgi:UDP-glucose 4-epimerase